MPWVFDIDETQLNLSCLDTVFAEEAGGAELDRWLSLVRAARGLSAMTDKSTAARGGEFSASPMWLPPVGHGRPSRAGVRHAVPVVYPSGPDLARLATLVEAGRLTVHIDQTLSLGDAASSRLAPQEGWRSWVPRTARSSSRSTESVPMAGVNQ